MSEATRLTGRMFNHGDSDGWQVWARIRLAIKALQAARDVFQEEQPRGVSGAPSGFGAAREPAQPFPPLVRARVITSLGSRSGDATITPTKRST